LDIILTHDPRELRFDHPGDRFAAPRYLVLLILFFARIRIADSLGGVGNPSTKLSEPSSRVQI